MRTLTMCACAMMITACGGDGPRSNGEDAGQASEERAPTVGAEIARDLTDQIERAQEVEKQALQQKEKIDAALREAEADPRRR